MFYQLNILISLVYFLNINTITIYECSNFDLLSEQCMLNWTDKNGNTHISLKTCPIKKVCKPSKDYSMGFCMKNIKIVLPGEKCKYKSECITNICSKKKCKGIEEHKYCNPRKKACNNNLSCRLTYENNEMAYRCEKLSSSNEICEINDHCELKLVCAKHKKLNLPKNEENININDLQKYISKENYLNLNFNKKCIQRASLKNGEFVDEAMACESGELIKINIFPDIEESVCSSKKKIIQDCDLNQKCIVEIDIGIFGTFNMEQECIFSSLGNLICPLNEKEKAWKEYLGKYEEILTNVEFEDKDNNSNEDEEDEGDSDSDSDIVHIPYNKDTLKNTELSEYFWKYNDWIHNIDADECVKQYFFVNSISFLIRYNIYLLLIYILLL